MKILQICPEQKMIIEHDLPNTGDAGRLKQFQELVDGNIETANYYVSDRCLNNLIAIEKEREFWKNVKTFKNELSLSVEEQFNRVKMKQLNKK